MLLFSNIERGNGVQEVVFVGVGHDLMFLGSFQHNLSKVVGAVSSQGRKQMKVPTAIFNLPIFISKRLQKLT